jgi:hypothetical protein
VGKLAICKGSPRTATINEAGHSEWFRMRGERRGLNKKGFAIYVRMRGEQRGLNKKGFAIYGSKLEWFILREAELDPFR